MGVRPEDQDGRTDAAVKAEGERQVPVASTALSHEPDRKWGREQYPRQPFEHDLRGEMEGPPDVPSDGLRRADPRMHAPQRQIAGPVDGPIPRGHDGSR